MASIDASPYILIVLAVLVVVLGFIAWNRPSLSINSKSENKAKMLINKLTKLAIYLIWLIGLSVMVMALGFIANWYTFDTFLWAPFEMVIISLLGTLFSTSIVIVHYGKGQGDDINEHVNLLAKHLVTQMKLIMAVLLIYIIKFLILGG